MGGLNVFAYAPNPTGWIDPLGLAVHAIYNKTRGIITVTDDDTGKSVSGRAFSGIANKYTSAPNGTYTITDFPWGSSAKEHYFALIYHDSNFDDYIDGMPTSYENQKYPFKGNIRLHAGATSHGCVTVPVDPKNPEWLAIQDMLNSTNKGKEVTINNEQFPNFGTFEIIGSGFGNYPNKSNNVPSTSNQIPVRRPQSDHLEEFWDDYIAP